MPTLECPFGKTEQCAVRDEKHIMKGHVASQDFCLGCGTLLAKVFVELVRKYSKEANIMPGSEPKVHILMHGNPLCGFTKEVPRDWPEGHSFLTIHEAMIQLEKITCSHCRLAATKRGESIA